MRMFIIHTLQSRSKRPSLLSFPPPLGRFLVSIPKQYSGMLKRIQLALEESSDMEALLSWEKFAGHFGLSVAAANHADLEASAVRIQVLFLDFSLFASFPLAGVCCLPPPLSSCLFSDDAWP